MLNYTKWDIENWCKQYEQHITHIIVAHTHHRPYAALAMDGDVTRYCEMKREQTSKDLRYALNCFNKLLYPNASNKPRRQPQLYRLLTLITIEGAKETLDQAQTIHANIAIGNLPKHLTTTHIAALFRHAWHEKAKQSDNIYVTEYQSNNGRWHGYSLKEAQQKANKLWETNGIWDVDNCWIPRSAISAD